MNVITVLAVEFAITHVIILALGLAILEKIKSPIAPPKAATEDK